MNMIEVSGMPVIKHLNMRAIGGGEDEPARPAIDIKVAFEGVPFDVIARVMGNEDPGEILALKYALYDQAGEGDPRFLDFGTVRMGKPLDGYQARIGRHTIRVETLKVIEYSFRPQHTVDMACQIAVIEPPEDMVTTLHEHLGLAFPVEISADPDYKPKEQQPAPGRDRSTPDMFEDATGPDDPLYAKAVEFVDGKDRASVPDLQRHLKIGYRRAAMIFEALVEAGLVAELVA